MLEHKSVQAVTGANDDVLAAIQHIRLWRVAGIGMQTGVPQRLSGQRIVSDEVARAVAAEQQLARRAQQTHSPAGRRVLPDDVARPVVDGAQEASHTSDATLGGAVARSSTKKKPLRLACASSLRGCPLIVPSNKTGTCVASQSCVSCGEHWKYQTIFPVSGFNATMEAVQRLSPFRH